MYAEGKENIEQALANVDSKKDLYALRRIEGNDHEALEGLYVCRTENRAK